MSATAPWIEHGLCVALPHSVSNALRQVSSAPPSLPFLLHVVVSLVQRLVPVVVAVRGHVVCCSCSLFRLHVVRLSAVRGASVWKFAATGTLRGRRGSNRCRLSLADRLAALAACTRCGFDQNDK